MRRSRIGIAVLLSALVVSACAGPLPVVPHKKGHSSVHKVAVTHGEVMAVLARYRKVRNLANELSDPKPLSTVEAGALLAVDSGSFDISRRLAEKQKTDESDVDAYDIAAPQLSTYPLWFLAKVRDRARGVVKVQIYERPTSVDGWLLVASPEILADTVLPSLRHGSGGTIVAVPADRTSGSVMSPQAAADTYAKTLTDPRSASARSIENDSFVRQMRTVADTNRLLRNVTFSQRWSAEDVEFAARTTDGGVLVFATLERLDKYDVKAGVAVKFPDGSPQQSFLGKGAATSGTLRYYHQILLYVPGAKGGKPRALGQYGGVVGADGF